MLYVISFSGSLVGSAVGSWSVWEGEVGGRDVDWRRAVLRTASSTNLDKTQIGCVAPCIIQGESLNACTWIKGVAFNYGLYPRISYVTGGRDVKCKTQVRNV